MLLDCYMGGSLDVDKRRLSGLFYVLSHVMYFISFVASFGVEFQIAQSFIECFKS